MLKRSLFAETDVLSVGNRSLFDRRANEVILCWKPKPVRQESKRSHSLLMHSCSAGSTNNQTFDRYFDHAKGELLARVFPPDMFTLQMSCLLDQLLGFPDCWISLN